MVSHCLPPVNRLRKQFISLPDEKDTIILKGPCPASRGVSYIPEAEDMYVCTKGLWADPLPVLKGKRKPLEQAKAKNTTGSPEMKIIIIVATDVFLLVGRGDGSSSNPRVCFKNKTPQKNPFPTHLTFIGSHFGKQSLRYLGPFHLLLDLVVNGSCDVDVGAVRLNGEVCCRCRGFGLPRDHENNN